AYRDLPHLHSFPTRRSSDLHRFRNLRCAGSVAVNADGLGVHANFATVAGDHYASLRDAQRLPRRLLRIADQRILKFARAQSSIRDRKSTRLNSSHVSISYAV